MLLAFSALGASAGCGKSPAPGRRTTPSASADAAGEGGAPGLAGAGGVDAPAAGGSLPPSEAGAGAASEPVAAPPGLLLRAITISQTNELPLMSAGSAVSKASRPAPLVAGKHALVRAFVDVTPAFVTRPLLGVLDLKTPQVTRTLVSERTITQSSLQDDLTSTFVFDVAAADLTPSSTYRVRVLETDTTPVAHFPEAGYAALQAQALPPFELVLVPFISNGFGPKLGDAEVTALEHRLLALYPSAKVEISVAAPVTLPYVVNGDGDGWDNALDRIYQLRAQAEPARDVFFFGAMAPSESYDSYCPNGCILGYSSVADDTDVDSRGSIGITVFQDGSGVKDAYDTVAHELGHALGRDHAPCGISDPKDIDPEFPYQNGGIGTTYGFDFELMKLVKPKPSRDVMSYCTPVWSSDYTYRNIFERLDYIASESFRALALAPHTLFRLARIRRSGESLWLDERRRHGTARERPIDLLDRSGQRVGTITAQVVAVDHARGGYVWLPAQELRDSGAASIDLRPLGGSVLAL
jgi:hypothetical protein